jgi:hypothetical protein
MGEAERPLESVIDALKQEAGNGTVRLGRLLDAFRNRSLGFVFLLFGLVASLPVIGAVPGVPAVVALVVLLSVGHSFIGGRAHFWAPEAVRRQRVDADRVSAWLEWIRPISRRVDGLVRPRLGILVDSPPARIAISLIAVGLALSMLVISIVPFLVLVASLGLMLFGLALMARDGLLALIGYVFAAGTVAALVAVLDRVL